MRLKNGELIAVSGALDTLSKEKFPIAFSFIVARTLKSIASQVETYGEYRQELIEKYAKRDDDGEKITRDNGITVEMNAGWKEELKELDDLHGDELDGISTKQLIKQCDKGKINIQASVLFGLSSILIDDVETKDEKDGSEE